MIIKDYEKGNELDFFKLDLSIEEHSFNRRDVNNWYWKYQGRNPFGKSYSKFCYLGKELIGHFAVIPINFILNNNIISGGNSIAMMVRNDFQNKGLIKFIGDKLFEVTDKQLKFIYGIPNERSYELHKVFFNYEDCIDLNFYSSNLDNFKFSNESSNSINQIFLFDDKYDFFWNDIKSQFTFTLNKCKEFMNWRYIDRPDHNYICYEFIEDNLIKGYVILKIYKESNIIKGHIMDLLVNDNDHVSANKLIRFSINFFKNNNLNNIFFYSNIISMLDKEILNKLNIVYKRKLIIKNNSDQQLEIKKTFSSNNFNFSMGDSLEIF